LRESENRLLGRLFGPKRDEVTGSGGNYIISSLMICTPRPIIWGDKIEKNEMGGACSAYEGEERLLQVIGEET